MANQTFWLDILSYLDRIESIDASESEAIVNLQNLLETVVEKHTHSFDPANEFEAYLVIRLCNAINKLIAREISISEQRCDQS